MKQTKRKTRIRVKVIFFLLFFVSVIIYFSGSCFSYLNQILTKEQEKQQLLAKLTIATEQYKQYEKDVSQLQIPEYLARYAREKYSLSKDSEILFKDLK